MMVSVALEYVRTMINIWAELENWMKNFVIFMKFSPHVLLSLSKYKRGGDCRDEVGLMEDSNRFFSIASQID